MTNDKPLAQNYQSNKEKSEINSDIRVLKILDRDLQRIPAEEIAFYSNVKLSVSIDSLLCYYYLKINCFRNRIMRMHLP